jgi:hypothetical protein
MMKANELRIGNLVDSYCVSEIIVHSVCSINNEVFNEDIGEIPLHSLTPIPITEEWLVRFGFLPVGLLYMHPNCDYISFDLKNKIIKIVHVWFTEVKIEYIHQIQNLYSSLTGEELTMKEYAKNTHA